VYASLARRRGRARLVGVATAALSALSAISAGAPGAESSAGSAPPARAGDGVLLAQRVPVGDGGTPLEDGGTGSVPPDATPEELEAIQRALSSDEAGRDKAAPPPAPPAQAPAPGAFSLQSLSPDLSFIANVAAAWFSSDEPFQTGGHDPTENGFNLQQLEMAVSKAVDPFFRFDAFIVFSQFGVEIEEVYATSLAFPWRTQIRVGQFLTRFGRINSTHLHSWAFVDQPFAIGRVFGSEGNRGLGAELSWLAPLPWYVELLGSITDARGEGTARSFFGAQPLPLESPLDFQSTGAVKQFFALSDNLSLLWGLSVATGPNSTGHRNRTDIYGTDVYLKYRPISDPSNPTIVSLQLEALYRRRQIPRELLEDLNGYAGRSSGASSRAGGSPRATSWAPVRICSGTQRERIRSIPSGDGSGSASPPT
jgi:hypothetical protein